MILFHIYYFSPEVRPDGTENILCRSRYFNPCVFLHFPLLYAIGFHLLFILQVMVMVM
jgi:hypothetical protein